MLLGQRLVAGARSKKSISIFSLPLLPTSAFVRAQSHY